MRIRFRPLGYAAGITAALLSTVCAALLAVAPSATIGILGLAVHTDLSWLAPRVTSAGYFVGLLFWGRGTGLVC